VLQKLQHSVAYPIYYILLTELVLPAIAKRPARRYVSVEVLAYTVVRITHTDHPCQPQEHF